MSDKYARMRADMRYWSWRVRDSLAEVLLNIACRLVQAHHAQFHDFPDECYVWIDEIEDYQ
jgi:hypothetical protein